MDSENKDPVVLVTGGSGFVGNRVIDELLDGECPIRTRKILNLDIKAPGEEKVPFCQADIRNLDQIRPYFEKVDIVIHAAAIIDWGTNPEQIVYDINVEGTKNIIKACQEFGVRVLVFCSSLDAIFGGKPLRDINEDQPYPEQFPNVYCESKYKAERLIREAESESLATCTIRPADIFGEGDPYHIGPILQMAKSGFYVRLGNGKSSCQHVYVGNVAWLLVIVASRLWSGDNTPRDKIYFATDGRENFFRFFDRIVIGAGYRIRPKNLWIPRRLAYSMGATTEFFAWLIRPIKPYNPGFSRFAVIYTCSDFTFTSKRVLKDLNIDWKYDHEQAIASTVDCYSLKRA